MCADIYKYVHIIYNNYDELRNYGEEWQHPQNDKVKAVLFTLPHSLPSLA